MSEAYLGEKIPKLGFGFMRLPMKDQEVDMDQVCSMVDTFMGNGFTYFDTAYVYHNERSEEYLKASLVDRYPRESYQVASKLPIWSLKTEEDVTKYFEVSRERLGVDYIDFYLLHAIDAKKAKTCEELRIWEILGETKKEGKIKNLGLSFHDTAEVMEDILSKHHHEIDFIQLQINYLDWESEKVQSRQCYEVALKYNMPIIVMEPVKGGTLAMLPNRATSVFKEACPEYSGASWAVRFCASLDNIVTVLSGMSTQEQVDDNVSYMKDFKALNDSEYKVVNQVVDILKSVDSIPCTSCQYCVPDCPMGIKIPDLFGMYNGNKMLGEEGEEPINMNGFKGKVKDSGKPSDCVGCGSCEAHCPQHINIIDKLKETADMYEPYL